MRSPRYSATVSSAPTRTAGANASQKRRAGPDSTGSAAARALRIIAHPPTASARNASATHTTVHPNGEGCRAANQAAASAVAPISTCPRPGTAVNEPARSMVERMKRRLSAALSCSG